MDNKKIIFKTLKILKTFGHIFLGLSVLTIVFPTYFMYFLMSTHLCKGWGCASSLAYSPFILLTSVIFYVLSRLSDGNIKENLLKTSSNNSLIMRLFLGIGLIVLGFIFNSIKLDGPDSATILIGLFFLLSSIVQLIVNYFKNKKVID